MIHSGSASSLDELYTQGCFKVAPEEWPAVRSEILAEAQKGPLYLHVQPGGVASFTNTQTLAQATIPTATTPGAPPVQPSQPSYTFNLPNNAPMGMGNNNPLNIKYYSGAEKTYSGLLGPSSNTDQGDPQMKFATPEAGWSAAYSLLNKKYGSGMKTPNQIIAGQGGWTPGNKQAALNVAKTTGIGPDDDINFSDPAKAQAFMRALVMQEQGAAGKAYPDAMIASAFWISAFWHHNSEHDTASYSDAPHGRSALYASCSRRGESRPNRGCRGDARAGGHGERAAEAVDQAAADEGRAGQRGRGQVAAAEARRRGRRRGPEASARSRSDAAGHARAGS